MKKIALCLYGYYNNRVDPYSGIKGYHYIRKTLLPKGLFDIFIHSWDVDNKFKILDLYKAKSSYFQKQIDFEQKAKNLGIDVNYIDQGFNRKSSKFKQCSVGSSLSFFYSRGKSIALMDKYSKENDLNYDSVITARFDLGHRSKKHRGYNVSTIKFDPYSDMKYIYSSMWSQLNAGYADQWFYSSQYNMNKLSEMYIKSIDYFKPQSAYEASITKGWFDSNGKDEFSNEIFKDQKSKDLVKYPRWQMINNHIMHKYFMKDIGLYDLSKFV